MTNRIKILRWHRSALCLLYKNECTPRRKRELCGKINELTKQINKMKTKQQNLVLSIIDFKDNCDTNGQSGAITAGIAGALKETLTSEQINYLIAQLSNETK
jgi:hypothetical protein